MGLGEARQRRRANARDVARQDDQAACFASERRLGLEQRVGGAELGFLAHEAQGGPTGQRRLDGLGLVTHDDCGRGRCKGLARVEHALDQ